jgi:hypothetical protein
MKRAHHATLQNGEEAFGGLHANAVDEILVGGMVDRLVAGKILADRQVRQSVVRMKLGLLVGMLGECGFQRLGLSAEFSR